MPSRRAAARSARAVGRSAPVGGGGGGGETALLAVLEDLAARRTSLGDVDVYDLPIVVACRDLISNTVSQCPMYAYGPDGQPRRDQPPILARPDPSELRYVTMTRLVMNLTGPGYVWLQPTAFYANDYPAAVRVIDASDAVPVWDATGRRMEEVIYQGVHYPQGPDGIVWLPYSVPVRTPGSPGKSPLLAAERALTYLAALWEMCGSFWEAGFPSIAYVVEQALNSTTRGEVKASMLESFRRRHEPTVVDRGGTFQQLGSSAVESQLVESIAVANAEVARVYGIMPSLVNVVSGDSLTYATSAAELAKWLKLGLGAYLLRVDAAFGEFTPYGTVVRSDPSGLLRADLEARTAFYNAGVAGGWLDVADIQAAEGLAPRSRNRPMSLLADPIGAIQ